MLPKQLSRTWRLRQNSFVMEAFVSASPIIRPRACGAPAAVHGFSTASSSSSAPAPRAQRRADAQASLAASKKSLVAGSTAGRTFFGSHGVEQLNGSPVAFESAPGALVIQANLVDRFFRVARATVNQIITKAEDPEKMLEQAVNEMQDDLIKVRKAAAEVIAGQKQTERQLLQAEKNAQEWLNRAQVAVKADNDELAKEALKRKKTQEELAASLRGQLQQQQQVADQLKTNMQTLEAKLADAKTKKDMYIARARSAQTQQKVNEMLGSVSSTGALQAFERMEEKVIKMEAAVEAESQLSIDSLEKQFQQLESGTTDEDLMKLKGEMGMLPGNVAPKQLPRSDVPQDALDVEVRRMKEDLGK
eukprot:tig00020816_g14134.t1